MPNDNAVSRVEALARRQISDEDLVDEWRQEAARETQVTVDDWIEALLGASFWRLLPVVCAILEDLAARPEFVPTVLKVGKRAAGDGAAGPLSHTLASIAKADSRRAEATMEQLKVAGAAGGVAPIAEFITGILEADLDAGGRLLNLHVGAADPSRTSEGYRAAVLYMERNSALPTIVKNVFIERAMPTGYAAQYYYFRGLERLLRTNQVEVERRFIELSGNGSAGTLSHLLWTVSKSEVTSATRQAIINSTRLRPDFSPGWEWAQALCAEIGSDPQFVLDALRGILTRAGGFERVADHALAVILERLGEANAKSAVRVIDECLVVAPPTLAEVTAGQLERLLPEGRAAELVSLVSSWGTSKPLHFEIRLRVLQDLVTKRRHLADDGVVACVHAEVSALGTEAHLDLTSVLGDETRRPFQALKIIDALLHPIPDVDYPQLKANMTLIPHVVAFIGQSWFDAQQRLATKGHPLLHMFDHKAVEQAGIDDAFRRVDLAGSPFQLLADVIWIKGLLRRRQIFAFWDDVFSRMDRAGHGMADFRRNLENPGQTEGTLCEAEVIGYLRRELPVQAGIRLPNCPKKFDAQAECADQAPILEVYKPEPDRAIIYGSGVIGLNPQRLRDLIVRKYDEQVAAYSAHFTEPLILVVNCAGDPMARMHVEDALHGTSRTVMTIDTRTGEPVNSRVERASDGLTATNPGTSAISAVICYERALDAGGGGRLEGVLLENPSARIPLTAGTTAALKRALFGG